MNIYQFPVTCDICGGEGMGTYRTAGAAWDTRSTITHIDPRVCRDNLDRERRRVERERREWLRTLEPWTAPDFKREQQRLADLGRRIQEQKARVA